MKNESTVFTQGNTTTGLHIPPAMLKAVGLYTNCPVEYRTLPGAVVAFKKQMTILELANAANSIRTVADELFHALCDICGDCDGCAMECPYGAADFEMDLGLPEPLLEEAGIPNGTKLTAMAGEECILICPSAKMPSLQSVPGDLIDDLIACDVCPGELEDHIIKGDIVYGNE